LSLSDLDQIEMGELNDMIIEHGNDSYEYQELASQEDFDNF
jgi:hypothetical protein